jgi:tetratricopeptide (TPR) repeat protein
MFDKAIKNNKENGQYYFQRAKVKQKINKLEEAIIDYHNSIEKIGGND